MHAPVTFCLFFFLIIISEHPEYVSEKIFFLGGGVTICDNAVEPHFHDPLYNLTVIITCPLLWKHNNIDFGRITLSHHRMGHYQAAR